MRQLKRGLSFFVFLNILLILPLEVSAFSERWQANFSIRVFSPRVKTIFFKGKIYINKLNVRVEQEGSDEVNLYDFGQAVSIRIFPVDRVYFENPISHAKIIKAIKEGWVSPTKQFRTTKILLRRGMFNNQKARLMLITLKNKQQKAYLLRWETDNVGARPLRVIYPGSADETIIVDYHLLSEKPLPQESFYPPIEYLSLNPF